MASGMRSGGGGGLDQTSCARDSTLDSMLKIANLCSCCRGLKVSSHIPSPGGAIIDEGHGEYTSFATIQCMHLVKSMSSSRGPRHSLCSDCMPSHITYQLCWQLVCFSVCRRYSKQVLLWLTQCSHWSGDIIPGRYHGPRGPKCGRVTRGTAFSTSWSLRIEGPRCPKADSQVLEVVTRTRGQPFDDEL